MRGCEVEVEEGFESTSEVMEEYGGQTERIFLCSIFFPLGGREKEIGMPHRVAAGDAGPG